MKYLIKKGGYFYRPGSAGYSSGFDGAGLFDEKYAKNHAAHCEEVSIFPVTDIPREDIDNMREIVAAYDKETGGEDILGHMNNINWQKIPSESGWYWAEFYHAGKYRLEMVQVYGRKNQLSFKFWDDGIKKWGSWTIKKLNPSHSCNARFFGPVNSPEGAKGPDWFFPNNDKVNVND